jgi:hypothetical protein
VGVTSPLPNVQFFCETDKRSKKVSKVTIESAPWLDSGVLTSLTHNRNTRTLVASVSEIESYTF